MLMSLWDIKAKCNFAMGSRETANYIVYTTSFRGNQKLSPPKTGFLTLICVELLRDQTTTDSCEKSQIR